MASTMTSKKHTVISEDEVPYDVLDTPGTVEFDSVKYAGNCDCGDGYRFHHVFIQASVIADACLPLDANPRVAFPRVSYQDRC